MTDTLTPARAREIRPGQWLHDAAVRGLALRGKLRPGVGAWYLSYTTRDGQRRRPTLGSYPQIGVDAARNAARELLQEIAAGRDPSAEWQQRRSEPTVADLCAMWLNTQSAVLAPQSYEVEAIRIRAHIMRAPIATLRVNSVTTADVDAFLLGVREHRYKASPRRGAPALVGANRCRALLKRVFALALKEWTRDGRPIRDRALGNPCDAAVRATEQPRRHKIEPEQMPRFMAVLAELEPQYPYHVAALRLMMLTGMRPGEVKRARREWVSGRTITFAQHKTSRRTGAKDVTLPAPAVDLIARLPPRPDGLIVGNLCLEDIWATVRERTGLHNLQMRDLRRVFASYAADQGMTLTDFGNMLGHTNPQTTNRYTWLFNSRAVSAADKIAAAMQADGMVRPDNARLERLSAAVATLPDAADVTVRVGDLRELLRYSGKDYA